MLAQRLSVAADRPVAPSAAHGPAHPSAQGTAHGTAHAGMHPAVHAVLDPDAERVAKAQAGDRAAVGALFKRHHGRVRAMCVRMLSGRDAAEIEDAVQQAFLEAWRCLPRFGGKSRFTTWLTRVAIHTCFSTRRRLRRLFVTDVNTDRAVIPVWAQPGLSPDEVAGRRARETAVADVLSALGPKKRAVFVLADLEGMTSTEIAAVLAIPDATVRTRLYHARREVAALVKSHPGFVDVLAGRDVTALRGSNSDVDGVDGGEQ